MSVKCKCGTYRRYGDEIAGRRVAQAMHLDACVNCGYVPNKKTDSTRTNVIVPNQSQEEPRRLGDMVSDGLNAIGGKRVSKAIEKVTGRDCGCNKRREFLNKIDEKIRGR